MVAAAGGGVAVFGLRGIYAMMAASNSPATRIATSGQGNLLSGCNLISGSCSCGAGRASRWRLRSRSNAELGSIGLVAIAIVMGCAEGGFAAPEGRGILPCYLQIGLEWNGSGRSVSSGYGDFA